LKAIGGWSYLSKRTVTDVDALRRAITGAADALARTRHLDD
jgi:hypothetical protein